MGAAGSFVSVFVVRLGASAFWVSMLSSIPAAIRLLMALPWSQFAQKQPRPQRVFALARLTAHTAYALLLIIPFFLNNEWTARIIVIAWSLIAFPGSLQSVMFSLVMGYAVPPERRSFMMSRRWMFMGVAKMVSLPLISQLIERAPFPLGYQLAFGINCVIAVGALYTALQVRSAHRPSGLTQPNTRPTSLRASLGDEIAAVWQAKAFLGYISGRSMRNLGIAMVAAAVPIYWVKHLEVTDTWVGYFNTALSAATLLAYLPWVRVKRKIGTWNTLILAVFGTTLYPALLSLTRSPLAVLPVIAFHGFAGAGLNLAYFDTLLATCPPDKRERFIALNVTAVNSTSFIGPAIGAALLAALPIRWVLVIGSLTSLLGLIIFIVVGARAKIPQQLETG